MAVYVIGSEGSRLVKIGWSVDPGKRTSQIGRMSAAPVTLLWQSGPEYGRETEAKLHRLLNPYRKHGEWFDLGTADPVALIRAMVDLPSDIPPKVERAIERAIESIRLTPAKPEPEMMLMEHPVTLTGDVFSD